MELQLYLPSLTAYSNPSPSCRWNWAKCGAAASQSSKCCIVCSLKVSLAHHDGEQFQDGEGFKCIQ